MAVEMNCDVDKAAPRIWIAPHDYTGRLAFSPNGKTLAFGGAGAVHLFDLTKAGIRPVGGLANRLDLTRPPAESGRTDSWSGHI